MSSRVALGGVLAAFLAGCGGQTETVTDDKSAPPPIPATSTTTTVRSVAEAVIVRVRRSVLPVSCAGPNGGDRFVGTGFRAKNGVVTASHVVAACPSGTTISFGYGSGSVSTDDPTHDLALIDQSEVLPNPDTDPDPKPLRPESRPAYVGQSLALLGIPAVPTIGNLFKRAVMVVPGTVVATHHPQVVTTELGVRKAHNDTIEVAVQGVAQGQSGGPAVDSAGKVVGVIVGGAPGFATLIPVSELASLRRAANRHI
jgi:S1-C subfamily serine protease